jgi:hypothetical protein
MQTQIHIHEPERRDYLSCLLVLLFAKVLLDVGSFPDTSAAIKICTIRRQK